MTIQGAGSAGSAAISLQSGAGPTQQTAAQKFAERQAEARAGTHDADDGPGTTLNLGTNINKLA